MINGELQLYLVSLEQQVYTGVIDHLTAPAYQGDLEVYRGHCAMLALLQPGQVKISFADDREPAFFYISGGVLEVWNNVVNLLADDIVRAEEIDAGAVTATMQEQQARLERRNDQEEKDHSYSQMLIKMAQTRAKLRARNSYSAARYARGKR